MSDIKKKGIYPEVRGEGDVTQKSKRNLSGARPGQLVPPPGSLAVGLQNLEIKLGVPPEEAARRLGLPKADDLEVGDAGGVDATSALLETLPAVLDETEEALEKMMLAAGISTGHAVGMRNRLL